MQVKKNDNFDTNHELKSNSLEVSHFPVIPFISGDGIGPEVMKAAIQVTESACRLAYSHSRQIEWKEIYAGAKAAEKFGDKSWLPDETLKDIEKYRVAIKGPLTTPVGKGIRSLNVQMRQSLDLFACVRPVRYFTGVPSVVKFPEKVNITVFRENTEDIYSGIEFSSRSADAQRIISEIKKIQPHCKINFPDTTAIGIKIISEEGSKRLIREAYNYAISNDCPTVTLVHKGNIMKYTEGAFTQWGYELAKVEFGAKECPESGQISFINPLTKRKIIINDCITDAFFQHVLIKPDQFSVIATMNLNGDYISDAVAAQIGGIGIAPGANINHRIHLYEATHGTAPKYLGLNKANPSSLILSSHMMLKDMGWVDAADIMLQGIKMAFMNKQMTQDIARYLKPAVPCLSTTSFAQAIIDSMEKSS